MLYRGRNIQKFQIFLKKNPKYFKVLEWSGMDFALRKALKSDFCGLHFVQPSRTK